MEHIHNKLMKLGWSLGNIPPKSKRESDLSDRVDLKCLPVYLLNGKVKLPLRSGPSPVETPGAALSSTTPTLLHTLVILGHYRAFPCPLQQ
jgi:hypothetical protein